MNLSLMEEIRKAFVAELQAKTGWGRNEVIAAYDKAVTTALFNQMGKQSK